MLLVVGGVLVCVGVCLCMLVRVVCVGVCWCGVGVCVCACACVLVWCWCCCWCCWCLNRSHDGISGSAGTDCANDGIHVKPLKIKPFLFDFLTLCTVARPELSNSHCLAASRVLRPVSSTSSVFAAYAVIAPQPAAHLNLYLVTFVGVGFLVCTFRLALQSFQRLPCILTSNGVESV